MTEKEQEKQEDVLWMRETQAAKHVGIPQSTLAGYIQRGLIETKPDVIDKRLTLVNVTQLKKLLRDHR